MTYNLLRVNDLQIYGLMAQSIIIYCHYLGVSGCYYALFIIYYYRVIFIT